MGGMVSLIVVVLAALALAAQAAQATIIGPITFGSDVDYINAPENSGGVFRDISNGTLINRGNDVGGTLHTALNFTLQPGSLVWWRCGEE